MTKEKMVESKSEPTESPSTESESKESESKESKTTTWAEPIKANEPTAAELTELLQRTQANFENYRKQTEKRVAEIKEMAARGIILQLLPVIDNFDLAFKNSHQQEQGFKEGIELIYGQLNLILAQHQVQLMETKNQRFDPYYHEALLKVESKQPEGTILEEFQKGFLLHGEVIRHAKVKISSGQSIKQTTELIRKKNQNDERNSSLENIEPDSIELDSGKQNIKSNTKLNTNMEE